LPLSVKNPNFTETSGNQPGPSMLDKIEYKIAEKLAEHHHYPYGKEIYVNIFRNFSHFPLNLKDLELDGDGNTITYIALVVQHCFRKEQIEFLSFYKNILQELRESPVAKLRYNRPVETFLGCILYYYHPVDIKNVLSSIAFQNIFRSKERYEFEIKKKTVMLYTI
jgi:hypothetical protein